MGWYATMTVAAETMHALFRAEPIGHFSTIAARVLIYFGALSFVIFVRTCALLRQYEASDAKLPAPFDQI